MIYVILFLIIMVSIALWRSSKQDNSNETTANNRFKKKTKVKKQRIQKEKPAKASSKKIVHRKEAINLHHPAYQSDNVAMADKALGLHESEEKNINLGEPVKLYLVADKLKPFLGESLIQYLFSTGLKFHKDGIFDRIYQTAHRSEVLFHVASMKEPGTFPTDHIDGYQTPGLVFYMEPGRDVQTFKQRFDAMLLQMTLIQTHIGGHIFTPDKILLEKNDFNRYADYLIALDEIVKENS